MRGAVLGLLRKAHTIRTSLGLPPDGRDEFAFDPDSGISEEDQKDVLRQIERVATQNRMDVRPEEFAVKAAKRGILFPVLVNLVAVIALVGGLGALYFFFQKGETQLSRSETGTITAEGKLIETFKKESEARLLEKNQQINQIQDRLQQIDKQRQDLQANMDSKIQERESQLKASMAAELEAEKARLQKQGLSEKDINSRLAALEAQRNAESSRQLEAFRAQAETDRQKADENLKALQAEFNSNLSKANLERQQVLDESKKREADLQAQLEQKTKEAASTQASSQQALAAFQSQKQQEDLVAGQLVGLYTVVKADISARDYPKALASLQAIRDYVTRADVAVLPAIQQRQDVDLFVVDSLSSYVQGQLSPAAMDTSSLVAAAGQISEVRTAVSQADTQARAGNIAEAEVLYDKALAVIPEIARSYAYFTTKARDAQSAREQVLNAGLTRAEAAFDAGRDPDMLAAYKDALSYLPETSVRLDTTLSNILSAGSEQGRTRTLADQGRAAAPILSQAEASLSKGKPADALSRYLTILDRYPQSPQAPAAVKGISKAAAALSDSADARLSAQEKELGAQVAALQGSKDNAAAFQKKIDALAAENQRLKTAADKAAADAAARQATAVGQQSAPGSSQDLASLRARLAALSSGYSAYTSREDPLLKARGDMGLVDTKAYLDDFLGSKPMEETFPGLFERIKRYDEGFLSAGRANAIQEVLDVVIEMSKQATPDARAKFLSDEQKAYSSDKDMTDLVKGLRSLMK